MPISNAFCAPHFLALLCWRRFQQMCMCPESVHHGGLSRYRGDSYCSYRGLLVIREISRCRALLQAGKTYRPFKIYEARICFMKPEKLTSRKPGETHLLLRNTEMRQKSSVLPPPSGEHRKSPESGAAKRITPAPIP